MRLQELKNLSQTIIQKMKDHGTFPKENDRLDYKKNLNISNNQTNTDIFLINFAKDILSFANKDGGIILIGFEEAIDNNILDTGLDTENIKTLSAIDINDIMQQIEKTTKACISIDLQEFQISSRKFYYLLIEKSSDVIIPISDHNKYKLKKGEIWYRETGKNQQANQSTTSINKFIQIKANEKSKEFMEIWSNLLPEMVDINPKEVLILNPVQNKIYGFNKEGNTLLGSDIEIDQDKNGVFNIILQSISAGEIGKITNTEGKPIYKIVGELLEKKDHISLATLEKQILEKSRFHITNVQIKKACHHLKWVDSISFPIENPPKGTLSEKFNSFIWVEVTDTIKKSNKIFFSPKAVDELLKIIDDDSKHKHIFGKTLDSSKNNNTKK